MNPDELTVQHKAEKVAWDIINADLRGEHYPISKLSADGDFIARLLGALAGYAAGAIHHAGLDSQDVQRLATNTRR